MNHEMARTCMVFCAGLFGVVTFMSGCTKHNTTLNLNAARSKPVIIAIVGDSTVADYPESDCLRGWGQMLPEFLDNRAVVKNFAKCGESSKSFMKSLWGEALKYKADYYFIQFGHNDCPGKGERTTDPNTDYQQYLSKYIYDVRAIGSKPVLVTPMERRSFEKNGTVHMTLKIYVEAMKQVSKREGVPLIDLNKKSIELYQKLGDKGSSYLMTSADRTHFTKAGARQMAIFIAEDICSQVPDLSMYDLLCR